MNLAAVEDPHSGSSKMSLNDLSHLDDSELNIMNSREMLAVSKTKTTSTSNNQSNASSIVSSPSSGGGGAAVARARPASADDSVIDDSARVSIYCVLIYRRTLYNLDLLTGHANERRTN